MEVNHPFARPGQVSADLPAPDACMECGEPESAHAAPAFGPFQTEGQALEVPAVRAVYDAFDADPGAGKMAPHNYLMLVNACEAAGVDLGSPSSYDRQILALLAGFEPQACAVVAGLISRAGRAVSLAGWGLSVRQALIDAIRWQQANPSPNSADQVAIYATVASKLGIDLGPGGAS